MNSEVSIAHLCLVTIDVHKAKKASGLEVWKDRLATVVYPIETIWMLFLELEIKGLLRGENSGTWHQYTYNKLVSYIILISFIELVISLIL